MVLLELFLLWPLLLIGVPLVVSARRRIERRRAFAELNLFVGPLLLGVILLHAIFTSVPNNSSLRSEYGFFGYWFHPAHLDDLKRHKDLIMGLTTAAVLPALLALVISPRLVDRARGERLLALGFVAQMLTAMALYHVPLRIVEAARGRPWVLKSWDEFQGSLLNELQPAILFSFIFGAAALGATLRSLQSEDPAPEKGPPAAKRKRTSGKRRAD